MWQMLPWVGDVGHLRESQSHGEDESTAHVYNEDGLEQVRSILTNVGDDATLT